MIIKKGVIKGFNSAGYLATVHLAESVTVWLYRVPVARNIAAADVSTGRRCAVIFFSEANKDDAVVAAVY